MQDSTRSRVTTTHVIVVVSIVIALMVVAGLTVLSRSKATFEAELDRIRAAGEPLTLEEILPGGVSDEENGAQGLLAAVRLLTDAGPMPDPEDREACQDHLETVQETLVLLRETAERPTWLFAVNPALGGGLDLGHFRRATEVLALDAEVALDEGDLARAEADIRSICGIGDGATQFPLILTYMIRTSSGRKASDVLERVVREGKADGSACLRLAEEAETWISVDPLTWCLIGERCYGLQVFGLLSGGGGGGWPWSRAMTRLEATEYIRFLTRVIEVSRRPYHQAGDDLAALRSDVEDLPFYISVSRVGIPNLLESLRYSAGERARWGALVVALRIRGGESGLDGAPRDPFTGKPFIVKTDGGGTRIYSVGPDLVDDGGVEDKDIVIRIP